MALLDVGAGIEILQKGGAFFLESGNQTGLK